MKFIEWTKELSVKVKEIDDQHKNLINLINRAHALSEKKSPKEDLNSLLDEVIEFTRIHFSTEEKYFEKFDYPGKEEHEEEHIKLIQKVLKFKTKQEKGQDITHDLLEFLKDWLKDHLMKMDMKYVDFFQECGLK